MGLSARLEVALEVGLRSRAFRGVIGVLLAALCGYHVHAVHRFSLFIGHAGLSLPARVGLAVGVFAEPPFLGVSVLLLLLGWLALVARPKAGWAELFGVALFVCAMWLTGYLVGTGIHHSPSVDAGAAWLSMQDGVYVTSASGRAAARLRRA